MFLNITNVSSRMLLCVTIVLLLRKLLPVNSATINNNSWFEKKLNFTCLQMDTWDCFNLNKGYFQKPNKDISERTDVAGNNQILLNKGTTNTANTDIKSTDKSKNFDIVHPHVYTQPIKNIRPEMEDKNKDISTTYEYASSGHPQSSRNSRKLGQLSEEEPEDITDEANGSDNRYMEMADSLWSSSFRTARISRKMWMAILAGIILKFASLLPLILGKFALLGTVSIVASKLSLLIVALMAMRQLFTADFKGVGTFPDLGLGHHQAMGHHHQYLGQQQAPVGHYPQPMSPHGMNSYNPAMAMSYANLHQTAPAATHKKWG